MSIIEVLPGRFTLVRVPRARVGELAQQILRQVLRPSAHFLSLTANELELSLLAPGAADDFAPVARRDRGRRGRRAPEPVELSPDDWKVVQIPSPGAPLSRARVR
jgi:hypothetical protein